MQADEMHTYMWQSDWLAADIKFKTSMIITMARLKKPIYLTAGDFAPLTLATFVAVCKNILLCIL
ncbi:hypothetical protein NQ314_001942 [Rhamnusium bicolor]|uniref:Uncharacterized protein n=1 Tax=Rhamnusium bicolor TaxID=1586634 RepID=A0AAV8ZRC6_9CUCU|nr:hypothetical protein NQ314_001942 [Rhamnusium bicolor]